MTGLLVTKDRIPFDVDWRKKASVRSKEESLLDMISLTVKNLADKSNKTVDVFLNNHSTKEIAKAINTYGKAEGDIIPIIMLIVGHAQDLIDKYALDGKELSFARLLKLQKDFPDKSVSLLATYALAELDPKLAGLAGTLLTEKEPEITDFYVRYSPVKSQISYIDIKDINKQGLAAEKIFAQTNAVDKQVLETREKKTKETREENERRQREYLANKKIELTLNPTTVNNDEYKRAFINSTLIVRT